MSDLPPGVVEANGQRYMTDAKGALVPEELVKASDRLQDETVRGLHAKARAAAKALAEFKAAAFADVDAFQALLAERYGSKAGGAKGNVTLQSYDGLLRVQVQVADLIQFGPELQVAKGLVDECLDAWSADSQAELRAIVMNAFQVGKEGKINRGAVLGLLRLDIADARWQRAMDAIRDSIRVVDSKRYIRFASKAGRDAAWANLSLDIATA